MKHFIIKCCCCVVLWFFAGCNTPVKQTTSVTPPQDKLPKTALIDSSGNALLRLKEKLDTGIDFTASGTEPFWSLEIDFDKQLHFKKPGGFEMTTPVPDGIKAMDAPVVRYRAVTEGGEIIVQLAKRKCINSMSGAASLYSVTVDVKTNKEKDYSRYEGCGNYTADYRLNDIWVLERINEIELNRKDFVKGLPQLEINISQQKIFGHTGCNNLSGAAEVQGKKILFGKFIVTRMACSEMAFENRYLSSLQHCAVPYKVDQGKLHLMVATDSVYTYRKID